MPTYYYTAKSLKGEEKKGTKYAENKRELAQALRQQDYILISASTKKRRKVSLASVDILSKLERVSLTDKIMVTRNLKVMIGAGMSLPRALRTLAGQAKSSKFKRALNQIADRVIKGNRFSECLASYPGIFPDIYRSMVRVGEETGNLEEVLGNLAFHMERSHELKSKVKGALIYPAVIVAAMIGIGILMLVMVVPKLAKTFEELGIELPATTKFVIWLGTTLSQNFLMMALVILIFLIALRYAVKTKIGKKIMDKIFLKVPVISSIVVKTNSASTARTLSILTSSGVPIVRSLEIVSDSVGNFYFRQAVAKAAEEVKKGGKLSQALKPYQIYPALVIQMLKVGEETGETADVLKKLADFYEQGVTRSTKNMASIVEPVLMLIIGGVVGFFAISMVQPMYSMLGALK